MDKVYAEAMLPERISQLKELRKGVIASGRKTDSKSVALNKIKYDLGMCELIQKLLERWDDEEIELSEAADYTFDKLVMPIQRHKRLVV
jgi:hypothetical protein